MPYRGPFPQILLVNNWLMCLVNIFSFIFLLFDFLNFIDMRFKLLNLNHSSNIQIHDSFLCVFYYLHIIFFVKVQNLICSFISGIFLVTNWHWSHLKFVWSVFVWFLCISLDFNGLSLFFRRVLESSAPLRGASF